MIVPGALETAPRPKQLPAPQTSIACRIPRYDPERRALIPPSDAGSRPIAIDPMVAPETQTPLRLPSPIGSLEISAAPAGNVFNPTPGTPRPVGGPRSVNLACEPWPHTESPIDFLRNEPGTDGVYIPQIRTNTLRPSILILAGPPGATPLEGAGKGHPPVVSIAQLRETPPVPLKERARHLARR